MSVVLWKDGERSLCQPHELSYQLEAGYSLTNGKAKKSKKSEKSAETTTTEETNTESNDLVEVSEEDTRALAKSLKIRNWHNMKIAKLLLKIEEAQDAGQD